MELQKAMIYTCGVSLKSLVCAAVGECVLLPLQQVASFGNSEPLIVLTSQQQQQRSSSAAGSVSAARQKLDNIASRLQAALQPSATAAGSSISTLLKALRARVPAMVTAAFQSLSDFDKLMYPTLMTTMTNNLYIGIASTLAGTGSCQMHNKLAKLTAEYSKLRQDMMQEVNVTVNKVVEMCWDKLLNDVEVQIIRPVREFMTDQQHHQQQMQQSDGLCKALSDLVELQCFMAGMCSDSAGHDKQRRTAAARHDQPGCSSSSHSSDTDSFVQPLLPRSISQLVLEHPEDLNDEFLAAILPQTQQLALLTIKLLELSQQPPEGRLAQDCTLQQLRQQPQVLQWCAAALHLQPPEGIPPADVVQLWLGALPGPITVLQLHQAAAGSADRPREVEQSANDSGVDAAADRVDQQRRAGSAAASVPGDTSVVGSVGYMNLLTQLMKEVGG